MKVEDVMRAAKKTIPHPTRERTFVLDPKVTLRHKKTGIEVVVDAVDVRGMSPHTVHVVKYDLWLNVNEYELASPNLVSDEPNNAA